MRSSKLKSSTQVTKKKKDGRFSQMASTFEIQEDCNEAVDDELAKSVTELFLNGMDKEKHSSMVKDV